MGSWLYTRATFLDIPGKGSRIAHRDGLGFLMKRAWEMLLGVALIYEEIDTTERKDGRIKGPPALRQLLLQKKNSTKADKDVWYDARQKGFSSLVIFLLFGVAGWFHCHIDRRRFNPRDLFSLFGLVHQMANHNQSFLSPLRATDSKESGEIHVPWEHINHHLSILLTSTKVGQCTLNWYKAAHIWDKALTPTNLAPLLLKDFLDEIINRGYSLSSTGGLAPHFVMLKSGEDEAWKIRAHRLLVHGEKYMEDYDSELYRKGIYVDLPESEENDDGGKVIKNKNK